MLRNSRPEDGGNYRLETKTPELTFRRRIAVHEGPPGESEACPAGRSPPGVFTLT
jgi:hypothetical protein